VLRKLLFKLIYRLNSPSIIKKDKKERKREYQSLIFDGYIVRKFIFLVLKLRIFDGRVGFTMLDIAIMRQVAAKTPKAI